MKEDFLHFIWKFRLFNTLNLFTTEGEKIEIIQTGNHNHHSGPDFSNARIKIGDTVWTGNLEIHIKGSHWYEHSHQSDVAYKNVILHVVFENDIVVHHHKEGDLPVLELKEYILTEYLEKYEKLVSSRGWIPCASQFPKIDKFKMNQWLERQLVNRFQRKSIDIIRIYYECDKDWNETFYRWISRSFGLKINANAFEELTSRTPLKLLKKHSSSLFQVEALLFGQAGMLEKNFSEEYPKSLKSEYDFLARKYALHPMNRSEWKFSKTHPSNFPTKRIAQLSAFICSEQSTFSKLKSTEIPEIYNILTASTSEYWKNHYVLDKRTSQLRSTVMGKSSIESLIINGIATMLFTCGKKQEDEGMVEKAISILEELPPEKNGIIKKWIELEVMPVNAKHTQALIELKHEYCEKKKCLSCLLGSELIKTND